MSEYHNPVMLDECIEGLNIQPNGTYVDGERVTGEAFLAKVDASKLSFEDIPGSMAYLETLDPGEFTAKCAINIALMDGASRKAGKAIYDFLGLGFTGHGAPPHRRRHSAHRTAVRERLRSPRTR